MPVILVAFFVLICTILYLKVKNRASLTKARDSNYIAKLHWRDFEILIAKYYKKMGYNVSLLGGSGGDNGIDIFLKRRGKSSIVQCKHWKKTSVGVSVVREMYGVMVSENVDDVKIITSGKFTKEAYKFSEGKPIALINGNKLNQMLKF